MRQQACSKFPLLSGHVPSHTHHRVPVPCLHTQTSSLQAAAVIQSQSTSGASSIAQHAAVTALGMGPGGGPLVQEMIIAFEQRRVRTCTQGASGRAAGSWCCVHGRRRPQPVPS